MCRLMRAVRSMFTCVRSISASHPSKPASATSTRAFHSSQLHRSECDITHAANSRLGVHQDVNISCVPSRKQRGEQAFGGECVERGDVLFERVNACGVITLNRPEKMNTITPHMIDHILDTLQVARTFSITFPATPLLEFRASMQVVL